MWSGLAVMLLCTIIGLALARTRKSRRPTHVGGGKNRPYLAFGAVAFFLFGGIGAAASWPGNWVDFLGDAMRGWLGGKGWVIPAAIAAWLFIALLRDLWEDRSPDGPCFRAAWLAPLVFVMISGHLGDAAHSGARHVSNGLSHVAEQIFAR